jgi:hypothetical protein
MPPPRRSSSGFHGVRARLNGTFYAELCAGGFLLTLGTYDTPEFATRVYDVVAWLLRRPRRALNFPNMGSLEEMEFLAPLRASSLTRAVTATARRSAGSSSPTVTSSLMQ